MKTPKIPLAEIMAILLVAHAASGSDFRVSGRVIDGQTGDALEGVAVGFFFDPFASDPNALPSLLSTNTDATGEFVFLNLPGELSGHLQIIELPDGYLMPLTCRDNLFMRPVFMETG
jgi:hypothetical protein